MSSSRRKRRTELALFVEHPLIQRLLALRDTRIYFLREAERIASGGKPLLERCDEDWCRAVVTDISFRMSRIVVNMRLDGEPVLLIGNTVV